MTASPPRPAPAPRAICGICAEFLPHYCAAQVTIRRLGFGRRTITIIDRQPAGQNTGAAA